MVKQAHKQMYVFILNQYKFGLLLLLLP